MPTETFQAGEDFTVPDGVYELGIEGEGEAGGGTLPGSGGRVVGVLPVTPGEVLAIRETAGGVGNEDGGRAIDIRRGGTTLQDRVVVAAGGGGGASPGSVSDVPGGDGGPDTGEDGSYAGSTAVATGGTQSAGGSGGGSDGQDGALGVGGDAGQSDSGFGGGAGYYGGGGGASSDASGNPGGSGAGGSNYDDDLDTVSANERGTSTRSHGDGGLVTITYEAVHPEALTITETTATSNSLSWDPPSLSSGQSVVQYRIYRALASGAETADYTQIDTVDGSTTTYDDTGLLNGERYYYRVTADINDDETHESDVSNEVDAIVDLPAPVNASVSNVTDSAADMAWGANHNNGETRVEARPQGESQWGDDAPGGVETTVSRATESVSLSGLRNGEAYEARVVAVTEHAESVDVVVDIDVESGETVTVASGDTLSSESPYDVAGTIDISGTHDKQE